MSGHALPDRYQLLIGRRTGVIRSLWELPPHPADPPVYAAGCEFTLPSRLRGLAGACVAGGSGLSREEALGAAVGEAVERYCAATAFLTDQDVTAPLAFKALGEAAEHPREFALFSERQHRQPGFPFAPFQVDSPVRWTPMRSLAASQEVLAPACLVYLPYPPANGEAVIAPQLSTGLSCGLTHGEAVLHGICEIVERDAFMILWRNRLAPPRVDPEASGLDGVSDLWRRHFAVSGLEVTLYDLTADSGLPVIMALMRDREPRPIFTVGLAARPRLEEAARKALLEAAQGRAYVRQLLRARAGWDPGPRFENVRDFPDHAMLYSARPGLLRRLRFLERGPSAAPRPSTQSHDPGISSSLAGCHRIHPVPHLVKGLADWIAALGRLGCEVLVKDLTTADAADLGFHVVRVLIPQMQPLHGDHRFPFLGGERQYHATRVFPFASKDLLEEKLYTAPHPCP